MVSLTVSLHKKDEEKLEKFSWVNWSAVIKQELLEKEKLQEMLVKLESKEEQDFIKWSVDLGRKAKKESWKRLLSKLSPEERKGLLG